MAARRIWLAFSSSLCCSADKNNASAWRARTLRGYIAVLPDRLSGSQPVPEPLGLACALQARFCLSNEPRPRRGERASPNRSDLDVLLSIPWGLAVARLANGTDSPAR